MRRATAVVALALGLGLGACGGGSRHASAPTATRTTPQHGSRPVLRPDAKPRIVSGPHDKPVPILMYHVVTAAKPGTPYPELWVPERTFAAEMFALKQRGYTGVTLRRVFDYWRRGYALPRKPIVISFDDGYLSQYQHARKTLAALHWPGVLNLVLHNLGPGGLSTRQVRAMIAGGWELDSHTLSHVDLTTVGAAQLKHELSGSRARLRRTFGVAVDFFCYPAGRYNATVEAAVKAAGYDGATTTDLGYAAPADPYALKRIRVNGTDTTADVLAELKRYGSS